MVQRLKAEHREFRLELIQIEEVSDFSWQKAIRMLNEIRKPILLHAVEEEARIVRVIMQKAKDESEESIRVMQEHRGFWINAFLNLRIPLKKSETRLHVLAIICENISQKRRRLFFLLR
jgi:RNA binding exosome subunit